MSLEDLNRFIYTSSTNDLYNANVNSLHSIINKLVDDGNLKDILKKIGDYCDLNITFKNIDTVAYILAYLVTMRKNENITNAAYTTLKDISDNPLYLFAFISYHKYLSESEAKKSTDKKYGKGWGKGQRKVITRWYNGRNEEDLLRLVTKYTHSHQWSHKDLIKMARIKPANDSFDVIFKYILFGYEKIQNNKPNDNLQVIYDFISDKEQLKKVENPNDAASLIRKHKFHLEHIPVHLHRTKEVWEALIEDMNLQQFCSYIDVFIGKRLLKASPETQTEKFVLEKLLSNDKILMSKVNPFEPLIALQIYKNYRLNTTEGTEILSSNNDRLQDALFNAFKLSIENNQLKSNKRILVLNAYNSQMKGGFSNFKVVRPYHVSACISLCMLYGEQNCDFVVLNDKINELKIGSKAENPDLKSFESKYNELTGNEKCSEEQFIKWLVDNNKNYDAIIYLVASNTNESQLINDMNKLRSENDSFKNTRLAIVNLLNKTNQTKDNSNLNLVFRTWNSDSFYLLQLFLNGHF